METDLNDLLAVWLGAELDETRQTQLLERLRADAAFRQSFVQEINMLGMLKAVQSTQPRWLSLEEELRGSQSINSPAEESSLDARVMDALSELPGRWAHLWKWLAGAGVGVALILAVGILANWFVPSAPREIALEETIAVAVQVDNVVWESGGDSTVKEGEVVGPGWLRLRSGRLYLALLNGVRLHIEGPAAVRLISVAQVFCTEGKLAVHVPPESAVKDFTISSPGAAVMDMGTEFGFNVTPGQPAELMVFKGAAEASVLAANGTTLRSEVLKEKVTAEIRPDLGQIRHLTLPRGKFLEAPDVETRSLNLSAGYPDAVRDSRPWGYWRFESLVGGAITNEIPGRPALRASGPLELSGETNGNHSIRFQPNDNSQFVQMDGRWTPSPSGDYAVEFLFSSEQYKDSSLAALITEKDAHHMMVELTAREPEHLVHKPGTLRFVHRQPAATAGGVNLFSTTIIFPCHWHHIVAQRRGNRAEMYIDGVLANTVDVGAPETIEPCLFLLGRLRHHPVPSDDLRTLTGHLDEVALYPHALSADEIEQHAQLVGIQDRSKLASAK